MLELLFLLHFISPYREDRQQAREIIGDLDFSEVFVDTSLEECERRDPKGSLQKGKSWGN